MSNETNTELNNSQRCWELAALLNAGRTEGLVTTEIYTTGLGVVKFTLYTIVMTEEDLRPLLQIAEMYGWYLSVQADEHNIVVVFNDKHAEPA